MVLSETYFISIGMSMFFVCAALKVRRVSRRCPGRSRICYYHAVIVLTVRHGAVTSSPAPPAQGGSGKVRQIRRRVDLHKQARVRISKLSKPQRR